MKQSRLIMNPKTVSKEHECLRHKQRIHCNSTWIIRLHKRRNRWLCWVVHPREHSVCMVVTRHFWKGLKFRVKHENNTNTDLCHESDHKTEAIHIVLKWAILFSISPKCMFPMLETEYLNKPRRWATSCTWMWTRYHGTSRAVKQRGTLTIEGDSTQFQHFFFFFFFFSRTVSS